MFEAIARGEIKALWVMGTNPAVSLPNADGVRDALKKLELFVVSENVVSNDTVDVRRACAAAGAGVGREIRHRDQFGTVYLAAARVPRSRRARPGPIGGSWARWPGASASARRFGFTFGGGYFSRARVALGIRERGRARLRHRRAARRCRTAISTRWRRCSGRSGRAAEPQARFFAEGGFFAGDFKARFIAPEIPALRTETTAARPLRLNTGRIRDQWHTMTRSGMSPRLGQHLPEPFVEVHPDDAARYGVADGDFARVTTDYGQCTLRVDRQRAPAARHAVRADPLERGQRDRRACRFAGGPYHRSVLRPAREQGDAGIDHALRIRVPRLCAVAQAARAARACVGRTRRRQWRLRLPVRRQRRSRGLAVLAEIVRARRRRRIRGFRRRGLSRGVLWRRPYRRLPVHRAGTRRRRLECGQGPVRRGCARQRAAPHAAVGQIGMALPMPARSSAPASASAATPSAIPSRAARVRRRTSGQN